MVQKVWHTSSGTSARAVILVLSDGKHLDAVNVSQLEASPLTIEHLDSNA